MISGSKQMALWAVDGRRNERLLVAATSSGQWGRRASGSLTCWRSTRSP